MTKVQSRGKCFFCGQIYAKGAFKPHLQACEVRKRSIENYEKGSKAKPKDIYHIVVAGKDFPEYWLHLELPAQTKLIALDEFLREIWLECCGHLSQFIIGDPHYSVYVDDHFEMPYEEYDMSAKIGDVLDVGDTCDYEYDFGSTTRLMVM